ncbi:MAG: cytochrome c biogenesis CcdA family protein [Candidatus Limnocylindrus sp.]
MSEISLLTAIVAGALSFLSPCVLPLVPAYLGRMSALRGEESPLLHATLFVGGFTSLFTLLGLGAAYAGGALAGLLPAIQLPLGVAVIVGGLHLAGFVRIPILDRGVAPRAVRAAGRSGSLLLGLAFAAAWTPCIGVVLGSILALAATSTDPVGATALLLSYSAGLGLPFIVIAGIAARGDNRTPQILSSLRRGTGTAGRLGGVLVALIGVAIAAGLLPQFARYLPGLPGL